MDCAVLQALSPALASPARIQHLQKPLSPDKAAERIDLRQIRRHVLDHRLTLVILPAHIHKSRIGLNFLKERNRHGGVGEPAPDYKLHVDRTEDVIGESDHNEKKAHGFLSMGQNLGLRVNGAIMFYVERKCK